MKRKKILIGIFVLIFLIIVFNNRTLQIAFVNATNNTKLPKEYDGYFEIDTGSTIRFGNYEMKLLFKSFQSVLHFMSTQNNLIVITSQIPTDRDAEEVEHDKYGGGTTIFQDFITYKLNKDGDIIDQYVFKRTYKNFTEILFGDYIINDSQEYYRTWVLDGDTLEKPFVIQNKNFEWNEAQQLDLFQKIYDEGHYYMITGDNYKKGQDDIKQEVIYYFKNQWYKLFINCILPDRILTKNKRGETTYLTNKWGTANGWNYIQPIYFQRIKMDVVTHSIGGNTPSTDEIVWAGNLYCQLHVDADTLKFKIPMSFGEYGEKNKFFDQQGAEIQVHKNALEKYYKPYDYYTSDSLNFKLFTLNGKELYVIKPLN